MLHWGEYLEAIEGFVSQSRNMAMFFKSLYKISPRTANITEIAPRTYELVNYFGEERFWKFVFEGKAGGKSSSSFENDFEGTKRYILSECSGNSTFYSQ